MTVSSEVSTIPKRGDWVLQLKPLCSSRHLTTEYTWSNRTVEVRVAPNSPDTYLPREFLQCKKFNGQQRANVEATMSQLLTEQPTEEMFVTSPWSMLVHGRICFNYTSSFVTVLSVPYHIPLKAIWYLQGRSVVWYRICIPLHKWQTFSLNSKQFNAWFEEGQNSQVSCSP